MSQIEEHLVDIFDETLKEIRADVHCDREKNDENCSLGPSSSEKTRIKH